MGLASRTTLEVGRLEPGFTGPRLRAGPRGRANSVPFSAVSLTHCSKLCWKSASTQRAGGNSQMITSPCLLPEALPMVTQHELSRGHRDHRANHLASPSLAVCGVADPISQPENWKQTGSEDERHESDCLGLFLFLGNTALVTQPQAVSLPAAPRDKPLFLPRTYIHPHRLWLSDPLPLIYS